MIEDSDYAKKPLAHLSVPTYDSPAELRPHQLLRTGPTFTLMLSWCLTLPWQQRWQLQLLPGMSFTAGSVLSFWPSREVIRCQIYREECVSKRKKGFPNMHLKYRNKNEFLTLPWIELCSIPISKNKIPFPNVSSWMLLFLLLSYEHFSSLLSLSPLCVPHSQSLLPPGSTRISPFASIKLFQIMNLHRENVSAYWLDWRLGYLNIAKVISISKFWGFFF